MWTIFNATSLPYGEQCGRMDFFWCYIQPTVHIHVCVDFITIYMYVHLFACACSCLQHLNLPTFFVSACNLCLCIMVCYTQDAIGGKLAYKGRLYMDKTVIIDLQDGTGKV